MREQDGSQGGGSRISRLLDDMTRLAERVPGGRLYARTVRAVESSALQLLKERMDRMNANDPSGASRTSAMPASTPGATLSLQQLLDAALEQTRDSARSALHAQILGQLTPDEARILSALADGARYPLIHVMSAPRVGGASRRLVENVSNIGKKAGVQLQDRARYYVGHLRTLELAETGPEDESVPTDYQMLETDTTVREVMEHVEKSGGGMKARVVRRTLHISKFGTEFWNACQGNPSP